MAAPDVAFASAPEPETVRRKRIRALLNDVALYRIVPVFDATDEDDVERNQQQQQPLLPPLLVEKRKRASTVRRHDDNNSSEKRQKLVARVRTQKELYLIGSRLPLKTHTFIGTGDSVKQTLLRYNGPTDVANGRGTWFACLVIYVPAHAHWNTPERRAAVTARWKKSRGIDCRTAWGIANVVLGDAQLQWVISERLIDPIEYRTTFTILCTRVYDADKFARFIANKYLPHIGADRLAALIQSDMRTQTRRRFPLKYFENLIEQYRPRNATIRTMASPVEEEDDVELAGDEHDDGGDASAGSFYDQDTYVDTRAFEAAVMQSQSQQQQQTH